MQPRDLSAHAAYVPGRGSEEVARDLGLDPDELVKLSSNENPHGASPAAVRAVEDAAESVSVYPTAAHTDLTGALADEWDVADDQVWVTPGADGAIDYLSRAVLAPGDEVLVPEPGFSYYPMSARYHHGSSSTYRLEKGEEFVLDADTVLADYDDQRVVFVTSPHNPTGSTLDPAEIDRLLDAVAGDTLVVVDEAYAEFHDAPSAIYRLAGEDPPDNLAVLRTFSKAYGLAGLRVGYAVVPPQWADAYAKVNTPFGVSQVGLRAALAALDDDEFVARSVASARWSREYLRTELDARTFDSAGNFVLADVGDATAVAERARERGVIVRDCSSFGLPECIRVSCGTREETERAVEVLNAVLAEVEA